jgi:membrane-associated phospholipid phosphatase
MRATEVINLLFFSFYTGLLQFRRLPAKAAIRASLIGGAGIALSIAPLIGGGSLSPLARSVVRDWLPGPLLLMAYWHVGSFVGAPNQKVQDWLDSIDHAVVGRMLSLLHTRRNWALVEAYFEVAYLLCYPLVPFGLGVLYLLHMGRRADMFWEAVLPPTYLCYGLVPFLQTLPPWLVSASDAVELKPARLRSLNLWILSRASIRANTLPSAHVAASLAASLVLVEFTPLIGAVFLVVSLSIAVGAVICRYHYIVDAIGGILLASLCFSFVTYFRLVYW